MHRRTFLNRSLITLGVLIGGWGVQRLFAGDRTEVFGDELTARITTVLVPLVPRVPTRKLADAYLAQQRDESELAVLVARLCAGWSPEEMSAPAEQVVARVRRQHRDDFANERTVEIEGWIVSLTEARVASLVRAS